MKVLVTYPLPAPTTVAVNTLHVGDGFLRVAGTPSATQPDFWILATIDANNNVNIFNPIDGGYITGVSGNMPVVPYPSVVTPIL